MTLPVSPINVRRRDRVAILSIDHPDRSLNVIDERVLSALGDHVDALMGDEEIDALVLMSAKEGSFGAGADIAWLPELAARDDAEDFLAGVHRLMVTLAGSPKPLVTALNGPAYGGALELALSGAEIVAVPTADLGLVEVTLGLLPGGGGTQLLGRWVPIADVAELLTAGTRLKASEAAARGLVTVVVGPDELLDEAVELARTLAAGTTRPAAPAYPDDALAVVAARRQSLATSKGGLSVAAERILDALATGVTDGLEAGLAAEREHFLALLRSPESRAALHLFSVEADVKRRSRGGTPDVTHLGVVGGGQMGAGIAATAVARGMSATVRDVAQDALERARAYRDKVLSRTAATEDGDPRAERWHATTAWDALDGAEAVVEAVFELPEVKTETLARLCETVDAHALIATNTSAIPIASLATAVKAPERFLGMHFFSPVDRMPLVELIPHADTAPVSVQRAASLGRQLGKVPVVVGDAPGFFTSRVYARWLMEGTRLLLEGVAPDVVDGAAKHAGFPVGPLAAHDQATLNLVLQASVSQVAERVMSERLDVTAIRTALEQLLAAGIEGRRQGSGFYRYTDGRPTGPNPDVLDILGATPTDMPVERIGERLRLAFASECFLCWDDGTLCHPDDGDVAAVLGIGFPRALGGPFGWADEVGASELLRRSAPLGAGAFPTGETLGRLADDGGSFHDEPRRLAPFQAVVRA